MHSRYALLIFPVIIISACVFIYDIFKLIWNKYAKWCILSIFITWTICTANFQFLPVSHYYFDHTSPQPDFKSAYAFIPDWENVISGFPTLCDRYYSERWTCSHAIKVDLIHDWKTDFSKKTEEGYTKIPYIDTIENLKPWSYYYIIDNLTEKSNNINWKLYRQLSDYWKVVYETWSSYNHISVIHLPVYN